MHRNVELPFRGWRMLDILWLQCPKQTILGDACADESITQLSNAKDRNLSVTFLSTCHPSEYCQVLHTAWLLLHDVSVSHGAIGSLKGIVAARDCLHCTNSQAQYIYHF